MMELFPINKEVNVSAYYFRSRRPGMRTFPKRIELDGTEYTFAENGLGYLVRKGTEIVRLFDMSDGNNTFRLRNSGSQWTLIGMKAGQ
ncbi:MAG TPA: hypothetical protein VFL85_04120 [Candidatus Saccharimonadales bacterium]|nr:hypothetical protein [Candidatus Saccharimonadales bacterium]